MAESVVTVTVPGMNNTGMRDKFFVAFGTLAIGAAPGTYTTGGIAFNLSHPLIKEQRAPVKVDVRGQAGFLYTFIPGTDNTNGKLMIRQDAGSGNPLAELTGGGAMPAGVSGDTISFEGQWLGML